MKNKFTIFGIIVILIIVLINIWQTGEEKNKTSIKSDDKIIQGNNIYLSKYAGGYTIEVSGVSSTENAEVYVLHKRGTAKWMYIENDGYGNASVKSEKLGKWTADSGKISITIIGNYGKIKDVYVLRQGKFVSTDFNDRYLKRTE
jgi:hypothetical protein